MANKTFSQKSARFFEIVCYILLIPAIASIIYTMIEAMFLVLIPLVITGIGVVLLVGYQRHSRGTFDKDKLSLLWFGTFVFNGVPLAPVFYQVILNSKKSSINFVLFTDPFFIIFALLSLWWIIAVSLSLTLIWDISRNRA